MTRASLTAEHWKRLLGHVGVALAIALPGCRTAGEPAALVPSNSMVIRAQEDSADEPPVTPPGGEVPIEAIPSGPVPVAPIGPVHAPLPRMLVTPWKPPGIACPWPEDEWIHDGGDRGIHVNITHEPALRGVDLEDTVAYADTEGGCKLIEPSNRVHLYAPRFLAVRKVTAVVQNRQNEKAGGTELPVAVVQSEERLLADAATQPVQPIADIGVKQLSISRLQEPAGRVVKRVAAADMNDAILPYENLQIIKIGVYERQEEALLAERIDAAITWSHDKAVQVIIDGRRADEVVGDQRAQATFRFDNPCNPRLRVIKVASTQVARPGDIVDFTIRFDNTGDEVLHNVALVDNLTTRLEYVADSAQSSVAAEFSTQHNEGDSLMLRWDFQEPLKPGEGGIVRFQCRVR